MAFHDISLEEEQAFRRQIEMLRRYFSIVDLPEFGRRLRGESVHTEDSMILTFDDGFVSCLRVAAILKEYGLRGVFFVPTDFVDCNSEVEQRTYVYQQLFYGQFPPGSLSENLRSMKWADICGLVAAGHQIGSHTRSHCPLYILNTEEKRLNELMVSADILETKLGCRVDAFAIPFGTFEVLSQETLAMLLQRYRYVFTSVRGNNQGSLGVPLCRETVTTNDSPSYVLFQAAGGLSWLYRRPRQMIARVVGLRVNGVDVEDRRP